jgi:putative aldouronate transport system substrate-binding protein
VKKFLSVVLVAALAMSMFAGFAVADTAQKDVVELNAVLYLNPEIELENNPIVAEIEKQTGIRLNITAPSVNDYWERVKIMIAAGDTPDFFIYGSDIQSTQWAEQGIFANVTDKIANYPNLMKNIDAQHWSDTAFFNDGQFYGVTRPGADNMFGYLINKKWLEKLGAEAPDTIDEFVEICRRFTLEDPDGNGKADTFGVGLSASGNGIAGSAVWAVDSEFLTVPFNTSWFLSRADADGKYNLRPFTDGYWGFLDLLRSMYSEGILDREFITQKSQEANVEKFAQNRVGIVGVNGANYPTAVIEKYGLNPDDYEFHTALALNKETPAIYMQEPCSWLAFYINKNSEHVDDVLRLLDWGNSEAGFVTMNLGLQGVHYNSYDLASRTIDRTPEQIKALNKVTSNYFSFAIGYEGRLPIEGGSSPEMVAAWQRDMAKAAEVTDRYRILPTKMLNNLSIDFPDDVMKLGTLEARYMIGQIEKAELESFLAEYKVKTQDYTDRYNAFRQANPIEVIKP